MSAVLDIDSLLESPLADLHALAGELDLDGYRLLRKSDLTIAILESRGAIGDEIRPAVEACRIVPGVLTGTAGVYGAARAFLVEEGA